MYRYLEVTHDHVPAGIRAKAERALELAHRLLGRPSFFDPELRWYTAETEEEKRFRLDEGEFFEGSVDDRLVMGMAPPGGDVIWIEYGQPDHELAHRVRAAQALVEQATKELQPVQVAHNALAFRISRARTARRYAVQQEAAERERLARLAAATPTSGLAGIKRLVQERLGGQR